MQGGRIFTEQGLWWKDIINCFWCVTWEIIVVYLSGEKRLYDGSFFRIKQDDFERTIGDNYFLKIKKRIDKDGIFDFYKINNLHHIFFYIIQDQKIGFFSFSFQSFIKKSRGMKK